MVLSECSGGMSIPNDNPRSIILEYYAHTTGSTDRNDIRGRDPILEFSILRPFYQVAIIGWHHDGRGNRCSSS
jgi:hypothetical protein